MRYNYSKNTSDTEMTTFNPIAHQRPPPLKPFNDYEKEKKKQSKAKEKRICVSIIILTFLGSVCIVFGTLYPELRRVELDMNPWRDLIQATVRQQGWLIRDKITIVNLGLWKYCYDDQLYDLVEIVNPMFTGRKKRSEEDHEVEKRQVASPGTFDIRCHDNPKPWKMPYHLQNKILGTKIALITSLAACVVSFLISILVLITRSAFPKLMLMLTCALGLIAACVGVGLILSANEDFLEYFNEAMGRSLVKIIREDFGMDLQAMSIDLKQADMVETIAGVSFVFTASTIFVMFVASVFAELIRSLS